MFPKSQMSEDLPPAEKHSMLKPSVSWAGLLETLVIFSLIVTWLGSLGQHHWLLDLLSHFRLQYILGCAVAVAFGLCRRHLWLVLIALFSLLWNVHLVNAVHRTAEPAATSTKLLKVMIFNVLGQNENQVAAIDHVFKADANIVCLLETDETWRVSLEPLRVKYPHRVEELGEGNFSIACYTRLPLKSSEVRRLTAWGLPTVILNLDYLGTPLTFIGTHPMPPMGSADHAQSWRDQLAQVGSIVAGIDGQVIVGGDLNATPWCEGMRLLREKSGLDFHSAAPVWPPTWGLNLPMMIPIDHVLTKGGLSVQKREIGPGLGSDHRSVLVEIAR